MKDIKDFLNEGLSWMKISSDVSEWLCNCKSIKEAKDIIGGIEIGFEKAINDLEKQSDDTKDIIEKYIQVKDYLLNIMKEMK